MFVAKYSRETRQLFAKKVVLTIVVRCNFLSQLFRKLTYIYCQLALIYCCSTKHDQINCLRKSCLDIDC